MIFENKHKNTIIHLVAALFLAAALVTLFLYRAEAAELSDEPAAAQEETEIEDVPAEYTEEVIDCTPGVVSEEVVAAINDYLEANRKNLSETQKAIIEACAATAPAPAGYCATWVTNVYSALGIKAYGNANDMWADLCLYDQRADLMPGMIIAVEHAGTDEKSAGYIYGHVGIYLGNGMVIDSHSVYWNEVYSGADEALTLMSLVAVDNAADSADNSAKSVLKNGDIIKKKAGETSIVSLADWLKTYDTYDSARWGYPEEAMKLIKYESTLKKQKTTASNLENGIKVKWTKDILADGYEVYRDGQLYAVVDDPQVYIFLDEMVSPGLEYSYDVVSYRVSDDGTEIEYSENTGAKQIRRINSPSNTKVTKVHEGNLVVWTEAAYAEKYFVYRRDSEDGVWILLGTVDAAKEDEIEDIESQYGYLDKLSEEEQEMNAYEYSVASYLSGWLSTKSEAVK